MKKITKLLTVWTILWVIVLLISLKDFYSDERIFPKEWLMGAAAFQMLFFTALIIGIYYGITFFMKIKSKRKKMTVTTKPSNVFKIIGINFLIACVVFPAYLFLIIYGAKEYQFDVGIFSILVLIVLCGIWGRILMWSIRKYGVSDQGR